MIPNNQTLKRSPIASLALRIGETVTIRTSDGWYAVGRIEDVRMSYGREQVKISQNQALPDNTGRWVDAERIR